MSNLFWWMKNDTSIIKAYWFYMPRLNVLFNVLIAVVFCEHRCRTGRECPRCYKRCGNAGALKTHMKTHKKVEPKSGSMLKWVVKRVKSEKKPKPKMAVELKPIKKARQLKLRKPIVRDPTIVPNPVRPRPPRRSRRSKQPPIDTNPFVAPARLPDLDKKSPQSRVAHIKHFKSLKSDFPI